MDFSIFGPKFLIKKQRELRIFLFLNIFIIQVKYLYKIHPLMDKTAKCFYLIFIVLLPDFIFMKKGNTPTKLGYLHDPRVHQFAQYLNY